MSDYPKSGHDHFAHLGMKITEPGDPDYVSPVDDSMFTVYGVWNVEDYYVDTLVEMHAQRLNAEAARDRLNAPYRESVLGRGFKTVDEDWPHEIREQEVFR